MLKEINLTTRLYDCNTLTLTDNENLQIKLVGTLYKGLTYFFKARNGSKFFQIKFVDNFIEIDRKNLSYGILSAKIVGMSNERIIKEFIIEDLILQDVGGKMAVIPEVEILKEEIKTMKEEKEDLIKKIEGLEKLCENTKKLVLELNEIQGKVGV